MSHKRAKAVRKVFKLADIDWKQHRTAYRIIKGFVNQTKTLEQAEGVAAHNLLWYKNAKMNNPDIWEKLR